MRVKQNSRNTAQNCKHKDRLNGGNARRKSCRDQEGWLGKDAGHNPDKVSAKNLSHINDIPGASPVAPFWARPSMEKVALHVGKEAAKVAR